MSKKTWTVSVDGTEHTIERNASLITGAFEIIVDGKVVKAFSRLSPTFGRSGRNARMAEHSERRVVEFEVGGKPAILRQTMFDYELFVDGQKVKK